MNDTPPPAHVPSLLEKLQTARLPLWVSLVLLVLLALSFGWYKFALNRAETRLEEERQSMTAQFHSDRSTLIAQVRQRAETQVADTQRRFGQALAWAVRGEMIRNNLDQVDQFFNEIIKLEGVGRVILAGSDGRVLVSSDRKFLSSDAAALHPAGALAHDGIVILDDAEGSKLMAITIMGLNARLGTVLLSYRPSAVLPDM